MRVRLIASAAILAAVGGFIACNDSTAPDSITYVALLNGANERPNAATTSATGVATYVLRGNELSYTVTVNGLSANTTMSHIHRGDATVAGPIIVPYLVAATQAGTVTSGTIDLSFPVVSGTSTITGDSLKVLLNNGNAYTNVHTSTFPGGEIRGQIVRQ
jgi:ABC-type proline/glycine betaine transport system substrate-binding protein